MTVPPGLREQKKSQTRNAIAQAALRLTDGRPYADVTVAEIATAAGVSRRTISNYYSSKADCFAGAVGGEFLTDMISELLMLETGTTGQRLAKAFRAIDLSYWRDISQLHQISRAEPEVAAAVAYAQQTQVDELTATLVEASGNKIEPLRMRVTIAVIAVCINTTTEHWLDGGSKGGPAALAAMVASSFDVLDLAWLDPHLDMLHALRQTDSDP